MESLSVLFWLFFQLLTKLGDSDWSKNVMISLINWLEKIILKTIYKSNQIPLFLLFHRFCVPQPNPYLHIYYFASTSPLLLSAHQRISTSTIYCSGPLKFRVRSRFEFQGIQLSHMPLPNNRDAYFESLVSG